MSIPFLLFEMDFDAELFKKYYGSIDNPGVYAIPEDEYEPIDQQEQQVQEPEGQPQQQEQQVQQQNQPQLPQFDQDTIAAADHEIEPIKKIFLLNKLSELATLLKSQMMTCNELNVILKFGGSLTYRSLQVLAVNIVNQVEQMLQQKQQNQQEQQVQKPEGQPQQQEQQVVQN